MLIVVGLVIVQGLCLPVETEQISQLDLIGKEGLYVWWLVCTFLIVKV